MFFFFFLITSFPPIHWCSPKLTSRHTMCRIPIITEGTQVPVSMTNCSHKRRPHLFLVKLCSTREPIFHFKFFFPSFCRVYREQIFSLCEVSKFRVWRPLRKKVGKLPACMVRGKKCTEGCCKIKQLMFFSL